MTAKENVLGVQVSAVNYTAAVTRVIDAAVAGQSLTVTALAVHGVMTGVLDSNHRQLLNEIDCVCPDGQPVRWALNLLHHANLTDRVYGPNLMLAICARAAEQELPIFLYGSKSETLSALAQHLQDLFPRLRIAGMRASCFRVLRDDEHEAVAAEIRASGARLVFCGLGCPRQEIWVHAFKTLLDMPLIAVGAAFDFHAGLLAQAPPLLQRLGLEWLFRLVCEPRRLWKRYLLLNPLFVMHFLMQWSGVRRYPVDLKPSHIPVDCPG